jgi:predicted phosphoribosyltransferase
MRRFTTKFTNRSEAGRELAGTLDAFRDRQDVIVLGLPRGGVPVAYEVADALRAPLDVFTVRKLGAPGNEEYAIGAIATGGIVAIDRGAMRVLGVSDAALEALIDRERRELVRRERLYRGDRAMPSLAGKTVIVVDDGLATGATMQVAVAALRMLKPLRIVAAAPVGSLEACATLRHVADACVCSRQPEPFLGVGAWYEDFSQTSDAEVLNLLRRAAAAPRADHALVPPAA